MSPREWGSLSKNKVGVDHVYRISKLVAGAAVAALSLCAAAQEQPPKLRGQHPQQQQHSTAAKLTPEQKFVFDTVNMAASLPESDPQDRLRVFAGAAGAIGRPRRSSAPPLWHEGVRIESELIRVRQ